MLKCGPEAAPNRVICVRSGHSPSATEMPFGAEPVTRPAAAGGRIVGLWQSRLTGWGVEFMEIVPDDAHAV